MCESCCDIISKQQKEIFILIEKYGVDKCLDEMINFIWLNNTKQEKYLNELQANLEVALSLYRNRYGEK